MPSASTGPILPVPLLTAVLLLGAALVASAPLAAQTRYVSDQLVINFRSLPSNDGRILKNLTSGTRLEVLEMPEEREWARVRTRDGSEGWVRTQYLVDQPVAADRLEAANREVEQLTRTVADLRERLATVQSARSEAEQSTSALTNQVAALEQELSEIKRVSSGAMEMARENQRLNELNGRLRDELDELVSERDRLASNSRERWMMIGGGLVLGGLLLGMIIKARPRRSAWA